MIRSYDLSRYRGSCKILYCEVRRFLRDVPFIIRYRFESGEFEFKAPASWTPLAISDEVRRFVELVNSPHWLSEIQPNLVCEVGLKLFEDRNLDSNGLQKLL